jgi:hypothetical protein
VGAGAAVRRNLPRAALEVVATGPASSRRGSSWEAPMWMHGSGGAAPLLVGAAVPSATRGPSCACSSGGSSVGMHQQSVSTG